MRSRENVNTVIQRFPFQLKRLDNEKKVDQNPAYEEPLISVAILKNCINRKHVANEMTLKPSNEVNYTESTHRYQGHSRPQVRHQHDPDNKESP